MGIEVWMPRVFTEKLNSFGYLFEEPLLPARLGLTARFSGFLGGFSVLLEPLVFLLGSGCPFQDVVQR